MNHRGVVIATMTLARHHHDEQMLERSLAELQQLGLPIVVADGGSSRAFVERLMRHRQLEVAPSTYGDGLMGQIKSSLAAALGLGTPAVLYTEPDKAWFFKHRLMRLIDQAPDPPDLGVVLAARSAESWSTFPAFQRYTEHVINDLCARVVGSLGDYSYGPFLMDRVVATRVLALPEDLGWGWRPCTFGLAKRLGLHIAHSIDDHACPFDQRSDDQQFYRLKQLQENASGLLRSQLLPL